MTDDDIRAVVRDAIARHVTPAAGNPPRPAAAGSGAVPGIDVEHRHSSQGLFVYQLGALDQDDGACLIEPSVRWMHCGYCQSYCD